jgi:CubicO group peptidase (beta-lactamase class C family)
MHRLLPLLTLMAAILTGCGGQDGLQGAAPAPAPGSIGSLGDGALGLQLESIRGRYRLPALTAMTFGTGGVIETGVAGVRAVGYPEAAGPGDQWHVGSLTKSMTSTLAAVLVELRRIAWDATIGETFPGQSMRPEYVTVRLDELLTHTAGMVTDVARAPSWPSLRTSRLPMHEQRRRLAAELLALPPESTRGTYSYANAGYVVAGTMLEEVTGEIWEDLMARLVFGPVGMTGSGFGPPGTPSRRDQPWGHAVQNAGFQPIPPGPDADNPPALGPAGTVHATLEDLVAYYRMHLNGARGVSSLVSADVFRKLHQPPPGSDYACGWSVVERSWAGGLALQHAGSNTIWYAVVWIAPGRGFGVFAATNAGGDVAARATDDAVGLLIQRFDAANPQR